MERGTSVLVRVTTSPETKRQVGPKLSALQGRSNNYGLAGGKQQDRQHRDGAPTHHSPPWDSPKHEEISFHSGKYCYWFRNIPETEVMILSGTHGTLHCLEKQKRYCMNCNPVFIIVCRADDQEFIFSYLEYCSVVVLAKREEAEWSSTGTWLGSRKKQGPRAQSRFNMLRKL